MQAKSKFFTELCHYPSHRLDGIQCYRLSHSSLHRPFKDWVIEFIKYRKTDDKDTNFPWNMFTFVE